MAPKLESRTRGGRLHTVTVAEPPRSWSDDFANWHDYSSLRMVQLEHFNA